MIFSRLVSIVTAKEVSIQWNNTTEAEGICREVDWRLSHRTMNLSQRSCEGKLWVLEWGWNLAMVCSTLASFPPGLRNTSMY